MARRIDLLRSRATAPVERSVFPSLSFQDYVNWFSFQGQQYSLAGSRPDMPSADFAGYVQGIHRKNGVVSAAVVARALLLSQLRFIWRNTRVSSTPGRTYGSPQLAPLERPGSTTRPDLLFRAELHDSYAGNAYFARQGNTIRLLRPDWVTIALGSDSDPTYDGNAYTPPSDARPIGYVYQPQGGGQKGKPEVFLAGEVAHWMPEPDPIDWWRGASWVTSVLREVATDGQVLDHQSKFFENAATPNLVFVMDPSKTPDQVKEFAALINEKHAGPAHRFKNMFLGGGADVKVVGANIEALGLKDISGGFETRVAARSRVPAVVLGIREGMAGSALNSGNYAQTRRLWADGWFTPTAQNLCASLEGIVPPAADSELWYDPAEVLFLQEDQKDAAEIEAQKAQTIRTLVDGGFKPESVVEAVQTQDMSKLQHTGLTSVQLVPPGTAGTPAA